MVRPGRSQSHCCPASSVRLRVSFSLKFWARSLEVGSVKLETFFKVFGCAAVGWYGSGFLVALVLAVVALLLDCSGFLGRECVFWRGRFRSRR